MRKKMTDLQIRHFAMMYKQGLFENNTCQTLIK